MIRAALFVGASVPIIWISRRSLLHPRSHGFSRFFAFEAIVALMLVNLPYWFADPFGPLQLVSWLLLGVSVVFVVWGFLLLRRLGGVRPADEALPAFEWENTGQLVTSGVYHYVRHPMYASLLFLTWGAVLKSVTIGTVVLGAVSSIALTLTAKAEEAENVVRFGEEYRDYMKRTRRFVPFLL